MGSPVGQWSTVHWCRWLQQGWDHLAHGMVLVWVRLLYSSSPVLLFFLATVVVGHGLTHSAATVLTYSSNQAVKSFANVDVHIDQPAKLCTIKSIPSHWTWSYNTQSITADVAYDLFSSSSAQGHQEFELMIWLAQLGGAGPISYTYGANGHPTPLVSNVQLGGYSWNLYKGTNGVQTVFSFVINQGPLTSFEGDVLSFWNYLIQHQGFDRNQFLITAQAGTEPFQGQNARLTNTFKLRIHNH